MLNFVFLVRPCVFTYMTFFPNVLPTPDIASKGIVLVNNSDLLYPGAVPFYFSEQSVPIIDNYSATIFGKCGRICKRRRRGSNKLDNPNVFQSWEAEVFRMEDTWDMIVQRDYGTCPTLSSPRGLCRVRTQVITQHKGVSKGCVKGVCLDRHAHLADTGFEVELSLWPEKKSIVSRACTTYHTLPVMVG
ncbi:hypothetical protein L211DRAFT_553649 [Terfezia boudieri ATCC MYA-4762]|uniref:Uncharacterized protein n=1 Tax=Terfezia boudieri ATCC MYA-4762 TaxID=1051890 RepID=A0A3N4LXF8_9PEZI|nr:hypothetical protein L211DRAFT_553649 [Terfezia boudieri ATCC MYA-4762]